MVIIIIKNTISLLSHLSLSRRSIIFLPSSPSDLLHLNSLPLLSPADDRKNGGSSPPNPAKLGRKSKKKNSELEK
jgi:hypothetical protein